MRWNAREPKASRASVASQLISFSDAVCFWRKCSGVSAKVNAAPGALFLPFSVKDSRSSACLKRCYAR